MLTNPFVLYDVAKLLFWVGLTLATLLGGILFATGGSGAVEDFMEYLQVSGILLGAFVLAYILVLLVLCGNAYRLRFSLTDRGVVCASLGRWTMLRGELRELPWTSFQLAREHPHRCAISLLNGWRVVVRLYCTEDNYAAVADWVRTHIERKVSL